MKEWPIAVVLSLMSGRLMCEFSDMHEFADWLAGESLFTHQFAHHGLMEELCEAIQSQHPQLKTFDAERVTKENWLQIVQEAANTYGPTLTLKPIDKFKSFAASFTEPLSLLGTKA